LYSGCLEDYRKVLKKYELTKPVEIDLKKFESEVNDLIVKILKYYEKNALGDKV
jgi:hypothetical protein